MSYIQQIPVESATGPIKEIYDAAKDRAGEVAEIIQVMSLDASVCRASMGLYMSMLKSTNALDTATGELLATVVSNVNDCFY